MTVYAVNPASGTILWTKNLPGAMDAAAPLIANNTVYAGTGASLIALSLQTGEQRWSFSTNGNIESRPAVVGNTVYLGSIDGDFYAVQVTPAASGPGYVATDFGALRSAMAVSRPTSHLKMALRFGDRG